MLILGVKVDNLTMLEALAKAASFLEDSRQHYIVTPNPEIILKARGDKELKEILNQASLNLADGFGLVLAAKFLQQPLKTNLAGVDFFYNFCTSSKMSGQKIFLLGGFNGVAQETAKKLKEKNPNLLIEVGEEINGAVEKINNFNPVAIFVALGAPRQEKWIYDNLKKMSSVRLAMVVGGTFDFISGRVPRAPLPLKKLGLEWLWRLMVEPRRVGRIYNAVVRFPFLVIKSRFVNN